MGRLVIDNTFTIKKIKMHSIGWAPIKGWSRWSKANSYEKLWPNCT